MKKILICCIIYLFTISVYADTCPPAPKGYLFRVAAWGDHASSSDMVRCHYYTPDYGKHMEIRPAAWLDQSAFINHPEWSAIDNLYYLCTSHGTDIRECPFG